MRIAKNDVPVKIDVPGATARHQADFGDASGYAAMAGEYFSFGEGTDITDLLRGLEGDLCQCPHWGYMIEGAILVTYADGASETVREGDLFYWPPGHTVKAERKSEVVLFSPQHEHAEVIEHIRGKVGS
jgi:hypothetical protein